MKKKARKRPAKASARKPAKRRRNPPEAPGYVSDRGNSRFVRDVLTRGEASRPGKGGKLPDQATHAIVDTPAGQVLKRDKFKLI